MGRKGKQITVGLVIIGGALVALAGFSLQQNLVYYLTVGEFLDYEGEIPPQGFRVDGKVVRGSVERASGTPGVTFAITDGTRSMQVAWARELPDAFKEGGEVVVEGTIDEGGVFRARTLLAKCPSKYQKQGDEHPEDIPIESADAAARAR